MVWIYPTPPPTQVFLVVAVIMVGEEMKETPLKPTKKGKRDEKREKGESPPFREGNSRKGKGKEERRELSGE